MIRDTARQYVREKQLPRITGARQESRNMEMKQT
jgi:hypothetical protein